MKSKAMKGEAEKAMKKKGEKAMKSKAIEEEAKKDGNPSKPAPSRPKLAELPMPAPSRPKHAELLMPAASFMDY